MDLKWNDKRDKEDFTKEGVITIVNTKDMVPLILRVPKVPMSQEGMSTISETSLQDKLRMVKNESMKF